MKIFITGSTGFLGQNLVKYYSGNTVFEYRRYMDVLGKLDYVKPDLIINCAAEIYAAEKMWNSNVKLVKDCLDYVKENPSTQFIQIGSSSEYGPVDYATDENCPIQPLDMYAATKGAATLLCQGVARTYNLDIQIIRPYSLYGPGERPHRLFPNLWKSFILGSPMSLTAGVHDFCYIDDFISGVECVRTSNQREPGEIVNISNGSMVTNDHVLSIFQQITGKKGNVEMIGRFTTPTVWQANITKITKKFGWAPQYNMETGVKKFIEAAYYE